MFVLRLVFTNKYKWMKRQLIIIQLICDNWIFEELMELGNLKRPLVFVMYTINGQPICGPNHFVFTKETKLCTVF